MGALVQLGQIFQPVTYEVSSGASSSERSREVREDVRAVVTLRLMKSSATRREECITQENGSALMGDAKSARARAATPGHHEEILTQVELAAAGTMSW